MSKAERPWHGFVGDFLPAFTKEQAESFAGKRVLITGAGGYLGSSLARALASLPISRLILLDVAEYGLYRLEQDIESCGTAPKADLIVGSVLDEGLIGDILREYRPQIIFHAAALKHVPLMESNAIAAASTNILGTEILVQAASRITDTRFILLSTDKAVEPISVMGATKRVAEQIVLAERFTKRSAARFEVVRLCNVLGSTGSVAPLFVRQIALGGPMTVSHPEATRYFMTTGDAVRHLLGTAVSTSPTGLTTPQVGPARRVQDLARFLVERCTQKGQNVQMIFTGLRAADKLHEQLLAPHEATQRRLESSLSFAVESYFDEQNLRSAMTAIRLAVVQRDRVRLLRALQQAVPDYVPSDHARRAAGEQA